MWPWAVPSPRGRAFPRAFPAARAGPAGRREYLDEVLVDRHTRFEALTSEVDRVLRQRASVLRQAGNRLDADIVATLDVWDDRLATAGARLRPALFESKTEI